MFEPDARLDRKLEHARPLLTKNMCMIFLRQVNSFCARVRIVRASPSATDRWPNNSQSRSRGSGLQSKAATGTTRSAPAPTEIIKPMNNLAMPATIDKNRQAGEFGRTALRSAQRSAAGLFGSVRRPALSAAGKLGDSPANSRRRLRTWPKLRPGSAFAPGRRRRRALRWSGPTIPSRRG